ncbi:SDR family oxidoreductase [Photorhabdus luminescens]|uniref:SDR family oxidoreductase n=1 Tax=Photorhabdus luminescens TaxID=29488 RepID=UPI0022408DC8|nr:SDR family oxidoreductase [Photorhabdus luminescens]MCW7762862.1 SDR family oxidoreductase [Photorhabdus luminescens subsp. venezuelensis]
MNKFTGASGLLGHAITEMLASNGSRMVITGRGENRLKELSRQYQDNCEIYSFSGDICHDNFRQQLIDFTCAKLGGLDVLINNAGAFHFGNLMDLIPEEIDQVITTNVTALIHMTYLALPYLLSSAQPSIINISSLAGKASLPGASCYAASKWAVIGFTVALQQELWQQGVRVCAISPGQLEVLGTVLPNNIGTISLSSVTDAIVFILQHPAGSCPAEIVLRPIASC